MNPFSDDHENDKSGGGFGGESPRGTAQRG
jgi:hypothetical protein